ncbi:MAG: peptidoglycan editing factor PgeF [Gammaproteobacteria bacterium]
MSGQPGWIAADWPAPRSIRAGVTTRLGGCSLGKYASFNLASHVGDEPAAVSENRRRLRAALALPAEPVWLNQVHGIQVCTDAVAGSTADASVSREAGQVCVVLTADCLPVLLCDQAGKVVAAAHAGWRGLAAGVVTETVRRMAVAPADILAWLGPAIGPRAFEVGEDVRSVFVDQDTAYHRAFEAHTPGKWMMDIYAAARLQLAGLGIPAVYGGGACTFTDSERFYSFRRDHETGRMASLIWISADDRV